MTTTTAPVAGWYPDPLDAAAHRYWDGTTWTEHTMPAVSPAPAPQPAAQVADYTPVQTVQQAPVPPVQYAMPQPATHVPAQASSLGDPFAVRPGGVRPGPRPSLYARRPKAGPSVAVKVLIGLAIAFGCVLVLGILAAIAIPVFLNQRAHGEAAAGSGTASGTGTTVTIPQEAAGLTLSNSPTAQQLSQQWSALPMPGDKSVGVYDDSSGRTRAAVLVSRVNLSVAQQGDFLRGAKVGVERSGSVDFHEVSPGPLGGHMQCAGAVGAKGTGTVCVFTDAQAIGMVDVFGSTTGDALAVQLREAVEHSS